MQISYTFLGLNIIIIIIVIQKVLRVFEPCKKETMQYNCQE